MERLYYLHHGKGVHLNIRLHFEDIGLVWSLDFECSKFFFILTLLKKLFLKTFYSVSHHFFPLKNVAYLGLKYPEFGSKLSITCNSAIISLFRNKRFMLDEMFQQNASKFAIFFGIRKPKQFFSFRALVYFNIDQGIH